MGAWLHPKDQHAIPVEPNKQKKCNNITAILFVIPSGWFVTSQSGLKSDGNYDHSFLEPALTAAAHFFPCSCGARAFFRGSLAADVHNFSRDVKRAAS